MRATRRIASRRSGEPCASPWPNTTSRRARSQPATISGRCWHDRRLGAAAAGRRAAVARLGSRVRRARPAERARRTVAAGRGLAEPGAGPGDGRHDGLVDRRRAVDPRSRRSDELRHLDRACCRRVGLHKLPRRRRSVGCPGHRRGRRRFRLDRGRWLGGTAPARRDAGPDRVVPGHRELGGPGLPRSDLAPPDIHYSVRALLPDHRHRRLGDRPGRRIRRLRVPPRHQRRSADGDHPAGEHGAHGTGPVPGRGPLQPRTECGRSRLRSVRLHPRGRERV